MGVSCCGAGSGSDRGERLAQRHDGSVARQARLRDVEMERSEAQSGRRHHASHAGVGPHRDGTETGPFRDDAAGGAARHCAIEINRKTSMTDPFRNACLYATKLVVDPLDRTRIAGRIEHVVTGCRADFADGAELVRVLAEAQAGGYLNASTRNADADPLTCPFHTNEEDR